MNVQNMAHFNQADLVLVIKRTDLQKKNTLLQSLSFRAK